MNFLENYFLARVQLIRSFKSVVKSGSSANISIIISTEENVPVAGLLKYCDLIFKFKNVDEPTDIPVKITNLLYNSAGDQAIVSIECPSQQGKYELRVDASSQLPQYHILPVVVGPIVVTENDVFNSPPIFKTRREIYFRNESANVISKLTSSSDTITRSMIELIEEYGSTLGSHIWDSSIVLLNYLNRADHNVPAITLEGTTVPIILELGAGCGLIGLYYAMKYNSTVYVTDKEYQLPLLRENIEVNRNQLLGTVFAESLDWTDNQQIKQFQEILLHHQHIDIITAADVLYDRSLAVSLFSTIRQLATPLLTIIYLAQKCRNNNNNYDVSPLKDITIKVEEVEGNTGFDISSELPDFHCCKVDDKSNVIIWEMKYLGTQLLIS